MTWIARTDRTVVGQWWWTVDRWTLVALGILLFTGVVLIVAGSPAVANRIGVEPFHFVKRHLLMLPIAIVLALGVSLLGKREIRGLAILMLIGSIVLLALTAMIGVEAKGAQRWLRIGGFTLQPAELAKPALAVVAAWLFARYRLTGEARYLVGNVLIVATVLIMIARQPDIGTSLLIGAVWLGQFFVAGMAIWLVIVGAVAGIGALAFAYTAFPHVASRIDRFLDPASGDNYQIEVAARAFRSGGLFGVGPGDGDIKHSLPDAHADFVFAVAGEELGLVVCLVIIALFAFVVLRGLWRIYGRRDLFTLLAVQGLLAVVGLQAVVNMASAVHLIPTKGMPLPFLSYGGTSLLALSITMGMVLALTRRRLPGDPDAEEPA